MDIVLSELDKLKNEYGFIEPNRGNLDDENIKWKTGKPDYAAANLAYFKGKTMNHEANSLEKVVEDLVKTWEMEATHKIDYSQWTTIDHQSYKVSANGGKVYNGEDAKLIGNYNWLLESCNKDLYNNENETFDSSHHLFRNAFTNGFPWEVLKVFSGPPKVAFTWRHWAHFTGEYKGHKGNNELVEMYGFCESTVDENLKIQNIEVFYKPNEFLEVLEGKRDVSCLERGNSLVGNGCPFMNTAKKN